MAGAVPGFSVEESEMLRLAQKRGLLNAEQQQEIVRRSRKAGVSAGAKDFGFLGNVGAGFNTVVTDLLDLPARAIAAGLQGMGFDVPDEPVRAAAAALNLTPEPGQKAFGAGGAVGEMIGLGAEMLVPVVGVAGRISKAKTTTEAVVKQIAESAFRQPARFAAMEVVSATAAGAAGFYTAKRFPDSDTAKVMAELVAGMTPAAALGLAKMLPTVLGAKIVRHIVRPFTKTGGQRRAEKRMQRAVVDPETAARSLDRSDVLPEAKLTPAQRVGEPEMLALEKSIIESSAALRMESDQQIAAANQAIRESLKATGAGPVAKTREILEAARDHLRGLLEIRVRIALRRADKRIQRLGSEANRETANRVARAELEKARIAGRAQETELWQAIPERTQVDLAATRQAYADDLAKRNEASDPKDIPDFVKKFLGVPTREVDRNILVTTEARRRVAFERRDVVNQKKDEALLKQEDPNQFDIEILKLDREILGLDARIADLRLDTKAALFDKPQEIGTVLTFRGRLLDEIAAARTTGGLTREKKRLLNALQSAIIDKDLSALAGQVDGETKTAVDLARQYSADFNDRFTRGPVADLLGRTRDRGVKTAEGLTLEVSVGRGGPVGREEVDALVGAMEFSGDLPAMQVAIEVYLKDAFKRKAVEGSRILKSQAKAFMKQFDDVLDRYPELKQDFERAIQADNAVVLAERRLKNVGKGLDDPRISRAAIFLKAPVDKELDAVMRSDNPFETMKELVKQAGRDPSGQALEGLKTGFGDWLLRNAQSGVTDANGEFFVSGKRLMTLLRTPQIKKSMLPLFNSGERGRLMRAARTAVQLENAARSGTSSEGIIGDVPSGLVTLVGRIMGAQVGRVVARRTGGGTVQTPGIISSRVKTALEAGVSDPAKKLLLAAIGDDALFRALLTEAATGARAKFVRTQLNGWLAGVLAEAGARIAADDKDRTNFEFIVPIAK